MKKDHKRFILRKGRREKSTNPLKTFKPGAIRRRWGKDEEDHPEREGMRRKNWRYLTDDFRPLRRFLKKRLGKDWNSVWAEICSYNDERSLDGWHFRMHVLQFVDTTGKWGQGSRYRGADTKPRGFYVDDVGRLQYAQTDHEIRQALYKKMDHKKFHFEKALEEGDVKIDDQHFERLNGLWYVLEEKGTHRIPDGYKRCPVTNLKVPAHRWVPRFVRKQLNKKELRRWGLKNDNQK